MAKIQPRNAFASISPDGFGGIGTRAPLSADGASDISNFRIRADGTLVPREGTRTLRDFKTTEEIRGFWEGTVQNQSVMFAVVGRTVYLFKSIAGTLVVCAELPKRTGRVRFVLYKDTLYLLDGEELLFWEPTSHKFKSIEPYVPLYGYMWEPKKMGEVNEPLNLLSPHVRIHYLNSSAGSVFYLPFYPKSIDLVRSPDKRISEYSFTPGSNVISIPEAASCSTVVISMTIDVDETVRNRILSATSGVSYAQKENETLLLYGTAGDGRTYCAANVSDASLHSCHLDYPNTLPIYFRADDVLFLGDSDHPVTAICPHYDSLLAFNNAQTWLLQPGENAVIDAYSLVNDTGAANTDGVTLCGESPAFVSSNGVYLIRSSPSRPETLTYQCISAPLDGHISAQTLRNALLFRNIQKDELWLATPNDPDGSIWVYNAPKKLWYRFSGIRAAFFAESSLGTVFARDGRLVLFDDALTTDEGNPFQCTYVSNYCDFNAPESARRTLRVSVCATLDDKEGELCVTTERGTKRFPLKGNALHVPSHFDFRVHMGRHRFLQYALSLPASSALVLYKLRIFANR